MLTVLEVEKRDSRTPWKQIWRNVVSISIPGRLKHYIIPNGAVIHAMELVILSKLTSPLRHIDRETKENSYDLTSPGSTTPSWYYLPNVQSNMWIMDQAPQSSTNSTMTSLLTGRLSSLYQVTANNDDPCRLEWRRDHGICIYKDLVILEHCKIPTEVLEMWFNFKP